MENKTKTKESKSILSKGLSLSVLTLASRILGLVREMTRSRFLGTSGLADAFNVAFMVPNLFRKLFAENSVSVAFIPTFKRYLENGDSEESKKETQDFINATFTLLSFCVVLFVLLSILATPLIIRIFYSKNVHPELLDETILLTRIMFPYLIIISVAAFFQGILNGIKIFSPSGFAPILFNGLVIAVTYILAPHMSNPARAMAIGVITGGCAQALCQLPFVLKNNWKIAFTSLKKAFTNPGTRKVLALIGPTIFGMAAYSLNDVVSTSLATHLTEGAASSLGYSLRLQELILGICAVTIGTVILPDLTGFAKNNKWDDYNRVLLQSIKIMALIAIPITFYSLVMGENMIALIYKAGMFDEESVRITKAVFSFHIAGLFFISVNRIVAPAFYAQEDSKSPAIAGIIGFVVNMILAWLMSLKFGAPGIALALTVSSIFNTAALFIFMFKKKSFNTAHILKATCIYSVKMILYSVIACVPIYFLKPYLLSIFGRFSNRVLNQGIPVFITAVVFAIVGVLMLFITKDPILFAILSKFRKSKVSEK